MFIALGVPVLLLGGVALPILYNRCSSGGTCGGAGLSSLLLMSVGGAFAAQGAFVITRQIKAARHGGKTIDVYAIGRPARTKTTTCPDEGTAVQLGRCCLVPRIDEGLAIPVRTEDAILIGRGRLVRVRGELRIKGVVVLEVGDRAVWPVGRIVQRPQDALHLVE